jgi:hypothetical protein
MSIEHNHREMFYCVRLLLIKNFVFAKNVRLFDGEKGEGVKIVR